METSNKDVKSLYNDLLKNYKKREIVAMAKYHDLNTNENKKRLAMNVAKANYISVKKANMDSADVRKTIENVHNANLEVLRKLDAGVKEMSEIEGSLYNMFVDKVDYLPKDFPLQNYSISELLNCFDPIYGGYKRLENDLEGIKKPSVPKLGVSPPPEKPATVSPKMPIFPSVPQGPPSPELTESAIASPTESPIFPDVPTHPFEDPEKPKYFEESPPPPQTTPGVPRRKVVPRKTELKRPSDRPKPEQPEKPTQPEIKRKVVPRKTEIKRPGDRPKPEQPMIKEDEPLFPPTGESMKCQTDEECQQKADLGLLKECKGQKVICVTKRDGSKACVYEPTN